MTEPPQKLHLQPLKHFQVSLLSIQTPGFAHFAPCHRCILTASVQDTRTKLGFFLRGSNVWTLLRTTRAIELARNGGRVTYGWVDAISTVVICILAPSIYSKLTPFRTLDYLYRPSMKGTT